jgi:hypothetical protein
MTLSNFAQPEFQVQKSRILMKRFDTFERDGKQWGRGHEIIQSSTQMLGLTH